jgi:hypothetical protein
VDFLPTVGNEFFVTLGRTGRGIDKTRLDMLKIIESEEKKDISSLKIKIKFLRRNIKMLFNNLIEKRN